MAWNPDVGAAERVETKKSTQTDRKRCGVRMYHKLRPSPPQKTNYNNKRGDSLSCRVAWNTRTTHPAPANHKFRSTRLDPVAKHPL